MPFQNEPNDPVTNVACSRWGFNIHVSKFAKPPDETVALNDGKSENCKYVMFPWTSDLFQVRSRTLLDLIIM